MKGRLAKQVLQWLTEGKNRLGEIQIFQRDGQFLLCHQSDEPSGSLKFYHSADDAIELGKYDAGGKYRPLRTAPTLQRGWLLSLDDAAELVRALDFFYPAMLGTALAWEEKRIAPVNLRDTLNRQTGMYRVAGKITNLQADALIGEVCSPSCCLKKITWQIDADAPISTLPAEKFPASVTSDQIPLPCEECCNILVAAARETVKKASAPPHSPSLSVSSSA